jgi:putative endonuclease
MSSSSHSSDQGESRRKTGAAHEKLAAHFFSDLGFEVLEQNWQAGHREIDLIAKKGNLVIFVEVKSASTKAFGHPAERVDKTKIRRLCSAAQQYLLAKKIEGVDLRFDVVTFVQGKLEHYPSAFEYEE